MKNNWKTANGLIADRFNQKLFTIVILKIIKKQNFVYVKKDYKTSCERQKNM